MTSVEATGNTLEEAKSRALGLLGVGRNAQVEFEVLSENPVRVRATLLGEDQPYAVAPQTARRVADYVDHFVRRLPLRVQAVLRGSHSRYVEIELVGRDANVLVGKSGEVLDQLQFLLNNIVSRVIDPHVRIVLDSAGWRRRRTERLRNQVIAIAKEVKLRGEEAVLPPMPAHERRIVHQALKDDPEVMTYSEGEEPHRYVVISPRE
ncbi:MAG: R3H domain-containing nucleic acid-binding protein [Armatimonadota bacterium]|nr:R3H domain-containing nucleic acid-binding protein [Armatimonadota bacterium]